MHISSRAAAAADEEMELATIPVIVEHDLVEQPIRPSSVVPISGPGSISHMRASDIPELELQEMIIPEMDVQVQLEPEAKAPSPETELFEPHSAPELEPSPPPAVPDVPTKEEGAEQTQASPEPTPQTKPEEDTPAPMLPPTTHEPPAEKEEKASSPATAEEAASASPTSSTSAPEETASDASSIIVPTPPASEGEPGTEDDDVEAGEIQVAIAPAAAPVAEPKDDAKAVKADDPTKTPAAKEEDQQSETTPE